MSLIGTAPAQTPTMRPRSFALLLLVVTLAGCNDPAADAGDASVDPDGSLAASDAAVVEEPAGLIAHWQVNIEWTPEDLGEDEFHHRAIEKAHLPDIIAAQELWGSALCGLGNHYETAGRTKFQICRTENYGAGSFLDLLQTKIGRQYDARYVTANSNAVLWDKARFSFVAATQWRFGETQPLRNACCGGAATEAGCPQTRNIVIATLLVDNRTTATTSDDTHVAVASVHTGGFGGTCILAHLEKTHATFDAWETAHAERPLARRFISGDLNTRADTTSSTGAQKRQELNPDCWWRSFVAGKTCGSNVGDYFDAVWERIWDGSTADTAPICGHWSWPMNSSGKKLCSDYADGSGQIYQRIDYTFVKGTGLTKQDLRSHVDQGYRDNNGDGNFDSGEAYSDSHKGVYTLVYY